MFETFFVDKQTHGDSPYLPMMKKILIHIIPIKKKMFVYSDAEVCLNLPDKKILIEKAGMMDHGWRDRWITGAELVGQNIRRLRRARGLKQNALAELCGYSSSKIERGQMVVDVNVAERIARALEVDPTELFLRREEQTPTQGSEALSTDMRRILAIWQSLNPEDRQTFQLTGELLASGESEIRRRLSEEIDYIADC